MATKNNKDKATSSEQGPHWGKLPAFASQHIAQISGLSAKVYMLLVLRCDWHTREVSISYPAIASGVGHKDTKRVKDAVASLIEHGLIQRVDRGKKGVANRYYLPLAEEGSKRPLPQEKTRGQNDPYPGVKMTPTPGVKMTPHYKSVFNKNSIQEAQRAQPQGQAGAARANDHQSQTGDACPECGAPAVGEGCCPSCGWDYGQLSLPSSPLQMCPECHLALQPDGTCWLHGRPQPGKEKGSEGSPSLDE